MCANVPPLPHSTTKYQASACLAIGDPQVSDDARRGRIYVWPDGVELPGVTTIITRGLGLTYDSPEAAARGTAIHEACALLDGSGDGSGLDWSSVPEEWYGYLHSWEKAKKWIGLGPCEIELPVRSNRYGYAGRLDRVSTLILVDLKSGSPEPWHALQTAAYLEAWRETIGRPRKFCTRMSVYLRENGTPAVQEHEDSTDLRVFLALAQVYHWRVATGG